MKIIDEKGKLFGKMNIIDILVLLVVAAVVVVLAWKGGSKVSEAVGMTESNTTTVEYQVIVNNANAALCQSVLAIDFSDEANSQVMNDGKLVDAQILSCELQPYYLTQVSEDGTLLRAEDPERGVLVFTLRAEASVVDYAYVVGSQELRIGKSYIVKTTALELTGSVSGLEVVHE